MKTNQPRAVGLRDLGQLTIRGNVAFAVRCAQRIRPCFKLPQDHPGGREQTAAVERAIRVAGLVCQGLPTEPGQAAAAARVAERAAAAVSKITGFAGYGAVRAAEAAAHAEACVSTPSDSGNLAVVAAAFSAARVLAANTDAIAFEVVAEAMCADLDKLRSLAPGNCEVLGPAVDPTESGPLGALWPAGVPACFAG
jgi:hypothetical protein